MNISDETIEMLLDKILNQIESMINKHQSISILKLNENDRQFATNYQNISTDVFNRPEAYINQYSLLNYHHLIANVFITKNKKHILHEGQIRLRLLNHNSRLMICINPKITNELLDNLVTASQTKIDQPTDDPETQKQKIKKHFNIEFGFNTLLYFGLALYFCFHNITKIHSVVTWTIICAILIITIISSLRANVLQHKYEKLNHKDAPNIPSISHKLQHTIDHINQSFVNYMTAKTNIK